MVRRTVTIPDQLDDRVRDAKLEGESFSAAIARILESGLEGRRLSYAGVGEGPGGTIAFREEEILGELIDEIIEDERTKL